MASNQSPASIQQKKLFILLGHIQTLKSLMHNLKRELEQQDIPVVKYNCVADQLHIELSRMYTKVQDLMANIPKDHKNAATNSTEAE
jgi:hypothetical protein